jgi:hypothetical protein
MANDRKKWAGSVSMGLAVMGAIAACAWAICTPAHASGLDFAPPSEPLPHGQLVNGQPGNGQIGNGQIGNGQLSHGQLGGGAETDHNDSEFSQAFSLDQLRGGETWVAVNLLAFVHDTLEEIDMLRLPLDAPAGGPPTPHDPPLATGPSDAQAIGPTGGSPIRTDMRLRTQRIQSSAAPTEALAAQRASEAREHELEAHDAALARQLQAQYGQPAQASDPAQSSPFDPRRNQLGYTQDYQQIAAGTPTGTAAAGSSAAGATGSGSYLVSIGGWLVALVVLQFGVRWVLTQR